MGRLHVPPVASPVRTDGLWRHSCFELFVQPIGAASYHEFNFAPDLRWAAYRFDAYRANMSDAPLVCAPSITRTVTPDQLTLAVRLPFADCRPCRIGLSAVVEDTGGSLSYWALAHPPGGPDFHHPIAFSLLMQGPDRP